MMPRMPPRKPIIPLVGLDRPTDLADLLPKREEPMRVALLHPPHDSVTEAMRHMLIARSTEQMNHGIFAIPPMEKGRETGMECRCGGPLHEVVPDANRLSRLTDRVVGEAPERRSFGFALGRGRRRRRVTWVDRRLAADHAMKRRVARLAVGLLQVGTRRPYVCGRCNRAEGFYSAIGRNMFKVQPMPPGAMPIYDRDPDTAAIVLGPDDPSAPTVGLRMREKIGIGVVAGGGEATPRSEGTPVEYGSTRKGPAGEQ